jgi:hypothetical protein
MATQEKDRICATLAQKLIASESLTDAERSHLATCEQCMTQAVAMLDELARNGEHAPTDRTARPEALKALEHGRRVFEREFGISLGAE